MKKEDFVKQMLYCIHIKSNVDALERKDVSQ